ncbi:hypothetical protein [Lacimicrobium alkaliphilum]|uniref:SH3b domain-containing protein n=1 Tax=Lacimicrobium alkaliphilum TaxID=1526571 RepID=A0ABQ1RUH0_9ALTE|nr:hypothetical protein [Lacimicrobium alkaliphilum]GGD78668.1 hypothetical protein GCM10011357_37070 [Lacimicrobium alkaliphilum]
MRSLQYVFFIILAAGGFGAVAAPNDTEAYYLCAHKITDNTSWTFGTAPAYCDIEPFGDPAFVSTYLADVVFDTSLPVSEERARYMNELNATIRDAAEYYLSVRKPDASAGEVDAWIEAIKAVATQETFWSHYRDSVIDGRMKMMRGDSGHGHGMMQIDDRWHFARINEGKGWQIFENMLYALEIFYAEWQNAEQASCITDPQNWQHRTRAAYAAYNGGPSQICRWKENPAWQDEGFLGKYEARSWLNYIADNNKAAPVDVPCMMEGTEFCVPEYVPPPYSLANPEYPWQYNYLQLNTGEICLLENDTFHCVAQQQDAACLNARFDRVSVAGAIELDEEQSTAYAKTVYEKHACMQYLENSFAVGQSISAEKAINIRQSAAGTDTGEGAVVGKVYQILDIVAGTPADQSRYYRIQYSGDNEGYIFAGGLWDFSEWASLAEHQELADEDRLIAMQGDEIYVTKSDGIALKDVAGEQGDEIARVTKDTALDVMGTVVLGDNNDIYYEVNLNSQNGYIYGGSLLPTSTLSDWTSFSPDDSDTPTPPAPPPSSPDDSGGGSVSYWILALLLIRRLKS